MNEEEQRNIDAGNCRRIEDEVIGIDATSSCCVPVPCGYRLGNSGSVLAGFAEQKAQWQESVRGWSGL